MPSTDSKNRMSRAVAKRIAKEFKRTTRRDAWAWTTAHAEIVDALVMDEIRVAWTADSAAVFTPAEIMEFRSMLVEELAAAGYPMEEAK